jgi:hypothetical protein
LCHHQHLKSLSILKILKTGEKQLEMGPLALAQALAQAQEGIPTWKTGGMILLVAMPPLNHRHHYHA